LSLLVQIPSERLREAVARPAHEIRMRDLAAPEVDEQRVAARVEHPPLAHDVPIEIRIAVGDEPVGMEHRLVDRSLELERSVPHAEALAVAKPRRLPVRGAEGIRDHRAVVEGPANG
jgi:hypothetical protein